MRVFIPYCLAACLLGLALPTLAWEQCLEADTKERFACLQAEEINNIGDLEFELQLAEAARAAGRYDYAAVVLERLVLVHPEQAGARLDLVILSLQAGDNISAAEHLNYLLSLPDPPPLALQLIRQLDRNFNASPAAVPGLGPDYRLRMGLGYDDNPNLGIAQQGIDIIIDGSGETLQPDDSLNPDPGAFISGAFNVDYAYSRAGLLRAEVSGRQYEGQSDEDNLASTVQVEHQVGENRYLQGILSDYRLRDGLYLTLMGVGGKQILGSCNCYSAGAGIDLMDGNDRAYRSARGRLNAEVKKIWGGVLFYGYSSVFAHRQPYAPWGDTYSLVVGADAAVDLAAGRAILGFSRYNSYDEHAYSSFFGDDKRNLIRNQISLGYSLEMLKGYELYLDGLYVDQQSSIPFYDYNRFVGELGLRLSF